MLLESMPYLMKQQQRPMGPGGHPGGQRGYQGGKPNGGPGGMRPNNRGQNMYQNRGPMGHGQMSGPNPGMMNQMGGGNVTPQMNQMAMQQMAMQQQQQPPQQQQ